MPSDIDNVPRFERIDGPATTVVLDAWLDGDLAASGHLLLSAFFDAYWGEPDPVPSIRIIHVELQRVTGPSGEANRRAAAERRVGMTP